MSFFPVNIFCFAVSGGSAGIMVRAPIMIINTKIGHMRFI